MVVSDLIAHIAFLQSPNYVIIVAGGSGSRMKSTIPKQFLLLSGLPVLMHTISSFHNCKTQPQIIVVLPVDSHEYWKSLCERYNFTILHQLVSGGETRFHSVKNGLDLIDNKDAVVAVHDAVRPLVATDIIDETYRYAKQYGNAVVAVKSRDSARLVKGDSSVSLVRDEVYLVQTPQTFQASQLMKAYLQPYQSNFTDDASVVEQAGFDIHLVNGSYQNIKITFPEDIGIAEFFLKGP